MDPRWHQLADILVRHSTGVRSGERVMIAMVELEAYPLTLALYEAVIKAGGYPQVQFLSEALRHAVMEHGVREQAAWVPEIEVYGMHWADVYFGLRAVADADIHADIPVDVVAAHQSAMGKVSTARWQNTRWCLVRIPTAALAQQAEVDRSTLTEMFFDACLLDWEAASLDWRALADRFEAASQVRILGVETDLRFSVAGRRWVVLDGRLNMPDGEIFTAPVNATLNGTITFELPAVYGGRTLTGVRLRWEDGELIEATSATHQAYLHEILRSDAGASRLGEFGIGTNPAVTHYCKDSLLDEKIGGTVHIALGRAYPQAGGKNRSAIHWDLVKDLRRGGRLLLDGRVVLENGAFVG
jgi:aminopeptidase